MSRLIKNFAAVVLLLFTTIFIPVNDLQAQIFEGVGTEEGIQYGLCLENPEDHPECANIDCDSPQHVNNPLCLSEAEVGTLIAKDSLEGSGITHTENFGDYIKKLVNFSLPYLTLAAFLGYVVAGFMYVTAFGNDDQIQKAKKILIYASVGLIIVILSYAITNLLTGELVESLD